ncbi:MAG: zinc-binding alcohol dehydrogenase [Anaerolineales bacterium]|nr:zinc-binding alcohol dehydrogenase [Anaerolineales bacterium]
MNRTCLLFTAPHQVEVVKETLPPLTSNQVRVETILSTVSSGTETMIYRGEFPAGDELDMSISSLSGKFQYPFQYGYSTVGRVIDVGSLVDQSWLGITVFSFQPHSSHFNATVNELIVVPDDLLFEQAVFLANMETAVNLVLDGTPLIGEDVLVFGQGLVGLFATSLLSSFPLNNLITLDCYPNRRTLSLETGATASFDPTEPGASEAVKSIIPNGADLAYELSGNPKALNQAIAMSRFSGRVVIGSWYGRKAASLELGGRFHRNRIHLVSSQVSTFEPLLSGRWDKPRRYQIAWDSIRKVDPSRFITHRFHIGDAQQAYRLLDRKPGEALGIVFSYQ